MSLTTKKKLKVLFVASECTPVAKVGGLGDVVGSLPKALKKIGIDVRIAIPKYKVITGGESKFKLIAKKIKVKRSRVNVLQGSLPESNIILYLLAKERYFAEDGIYLEKSAFVGSFKEIQRFLFFSKAVLEVFQNHSWKPDVIHCHDWHTAIIPLLLQSTIYSLQSKTLLTIHNLANQGKWRAADVLHFLGLKGYEVESLKHKDKRKRLNILAQGILNADLLNTVSKTYSREILTKKYGEGLEKVLQKRKRNLYGILNGIDQQRFNPQTDPNLKQNFSLSSLNKKKANKTYLQKISQLSQSETTPLFGSVGRLVEQKGIDLIAEIIPKLVKSNSQLVILGTGREKHEKEFSQLVKKYPQHISVHIKFDAALAQRIYAGSDFFLIPSKFEPCGLIQMIAMRYGTVPIGRKTGGLADTIENKKTGFLFKKYKPQSFWQAIKRALRVYQNKEKMNSMIKSGMKKNFSWKKSAQEYLKLYKILVK